MQSDAVGWACLCSADDASGDCAGAARRASAAGAAAARSTGCSRLRRARRRAGTRAREHPPDDSAARCAAASRRRATGRGAAPSRFDLVHARVPQRVRLRARQCVSACNPPCPAGQMCTAAGECDAEAGAAAARCSIRPRPRSRAARDPSAEAPRRLHAASHARLRRRRATRDVRIDDFGLLGRRRQDQVLRARRHAQRSTSAPRSSRT